MADLNHQLLAPQALFPLLPVLPSVLGDEVTSILCGIFNATDDRRLPGMNFPWYPGCTPALCKGPG